MIRSHDSVRELGPTGAEGEEAGAEACAGKGLGGNGELCVGSDWSATGISGMEDNLARDVNIAIVLS